MRLPRERAELSLALLSREDLRDEGFSDRQVQRCVRNRDLIEILPGVFRVAGAPSTYRQRLLAAQLWGGPGAAVSHRSAAALWELDGVPEGFVEVSTDRPITHPDVIVHRRSNLREDDLSRRRGIVVTTPTRTLLDLGAVLDLSSLERALEDALRRRLTHLDLLLRSFDRWARRGRRGTTGWRRLFEMRDPALKPTESGFETRLSQLCRRYDLPLAARQHEIFDERGLIGRADFAYPAGLIAIEAESLRFHLGRKEFQRDLRRTNRLQAAGWIVLRFSYLDLVARPEEVAAEIRGALVLRGVLAA